MNIPTFRQYVGEDTMSEVKEYLDAHPDEKRRGEEDAAEYNRIMSLKPNEITSAEEWWLRNRFK